MRSSGRKRAAALLGAVAASMAYADISKAANETWTITGADNWSDITAWGGGAAPGGVGTTNSTDTAFFGSTTGVAVTIDQVGQNIGSITFTGSSFIIGSTGGNALDLSSGGVIQTTSTFVTNGSANAIVDAPLVLENSSGGINGTYTFYSGANGTTSGSTSNGLTMYGTISGLATTVGTPTVLTLDGTWANYDTSHAQKGNQLNGIVSDGGGGGSLSIVKQGVGVWSLDAADTYSGDTVINSGELALNFGLFGAPLQNILPTQSRVDLGGGMLWERESNATTPVQTFNGLLINQGSSVVNVTRLAGGAITNIYGAVSRNLGGTVDIQGSNTSNQGQFVTNTNTNNILGGYATMNSGASWASVSTATLSSSSNHDLIPYVFSATEIGASAFATAADNVDVNTTDIAGVTSSVSVNSLRFNAASALNLNLATNTLTLSSGGILITPTVAANIPSITNGSITGSAGGDLIIDNWATTGGLTISANIVNNGSATGFTMSGAGTGSVTLSGNNTFTGSLYLNTGTLVLGSATALTQSNAILFGNATNTSGNDGSDTTATVALGGNSVAVSSLSQSNHAATLFPTIEDSIGTTTGNATLTVNGAGSSTFTGTLKDGTGTSGHLGVTMAGTGTLTLGGTLSYTGTTTVSSGTLNFNVAPSGSSQFVVNGNMGVTALPSSTLALSGSQSMIGTGQVVGGVSAASGAVLAPGTGTTTNGGSGSLSVTNLTLAAGVILNFGLNGTPTNNFINVTSGVLNLPSSGTAKLNLYSPGTSTAFAAAGTYDLFEASSLGTGSFTNLLINTSIAGYNATYAFSGGFLQLTLASAGVNGGWTNGSGDHTWSNPANWTGGIIPTNAGDAANFNQTTDPTTGTINLDTARTVGAIGFASTSGSFSIVGTNTLTLNNSGAGASISNSGTNSIAAPVALGDNLNILGAGSVTISGNISESKVGSSLTENALTGTLVLSGANSYTGGTNVASGTINFAHSAGNDGDLGAAGTAVTMSGGSLQWGTGNTDDISSDRTITLATGGGTFDTNGNGGTVGITINNPIGNGGVGGLTKAGLGTLTLAAANTYTGATQVSGGNLIVANNANLGTPSGAGGLIFNGGTFSPSASIALNNGANGTNDRPVTLSSTGTMALASGIALTVSGQITGSGALNVSGPGQLTIYNNTGAGTGTNTESGAILVNNGATVNLFDAPSQAYGLGTGSVSLDNGTINMVLPTQSTTPTAGTLSNTINVDGGFTGMIIDSPRGDLNGGVTGSGTLNIEVSYVRDQFDNNFTGYTGQLNITVNPIASGPSAGTPVTETAAEFRDDNVSIPNAKVNLGPGAIMDEVFNYGAAGGTVSLGQLTGDPTSYLGGDPTAGRSVFWSVGGLNTNFEYDGTIEDAGGSSISGMAAIVKVGTGNWTLTGNNTYTGTTTISAGTLTLGNLAVNGGASGSLNASAGTITDNANFAINRTGVIVQGTDFSANIITGTGVVTQEGPGTTYLQDSNTFSGGVVVNDGTLEANQVSAAGTGNATVNPTAANGTLGTSADNAYLYVNYDGALATTSNVVVNSEAAGVDNGFGLGIVVFSDSAPVIGSLAGNGIVDISSGGTLTIGNGTISTTFSGVINDNNPNGGGLPGPASLTLQGSGTLTLTNTNTYRGATTINTGATLQLGNGTTDGLIASTTGVTDNGTLIYDLVQANRNPAYAISGAGNVTLLGNETLTVSSTSTYSGTTTVNGGTLSVTGGIPNSGTINVGTASLIVGAPGAVLSTVAITNNGTANFNSSSGTNTVGSIAGTGTLIVGSGATLNVTSALTQGPVSSAGSLNVNGGTTNAVGTVDGAGSLTLANSSNLTATHIRQTNLNIGTGSTVTIADSLTGPGNTASTSILTDLSTSSNTGTLNLQNNDLIIKDSTQYAAVKAAITNAYSGGAWSGAGITSSSAALKSNAYGLGYSTIGSIGTTTFDGQTGLASGTVLVKYTLLGDTKLTGTVGLGDYNTVLANLNTGTLWSQGAFHPGTATGLGDYNAVLANFNVTASGSVAAPSVKAASIKAASITLSPAVTSNAATDMKLEVNTVTGDVFAVATTAVSLTGYDIFDSSNNLKDSGDPNTDLNELLLSQPTTNRGNTTTFRNATNYKLWTTILDNASTLAEGENNGKLKQGTASTYDTINVPSGGTIDFGHVYATATNKQDYTFSFSEADPTNAGNPVTGTTYGGEVDYVNTNSTPEPGMLGLLGLGGTMMMRRRRKSGGEATKA